MTKPTYCKYCQKDFDDHNTFKDHWAFECPTRIEKGFISKIRSYENYHDADVIAKVVAWVLARRNNSGYYIHCQDVDLCICEFKKVVENKFLMQVPEYSVIARDILSKLHEFEGWMQSRAENKRSIANRLEDEKKAYKKL